MAGGIGAGGRRRNGTRCGSQHEFSFSKRFLTFVLAAALLNRVSWSSYPEHKIKLVENKYERDSDCGLLISLHVPDKN